MQSEVRGLDERLVEASPSAKLVAYVLENEGEMGMERLVRCSRLPWSTARYAVDSLTDLGVVEERRGEEGVVYGLKH